MDLFNFLKKKKQDDFETLLQKAANEPACQIEFLKRLLNEKLVVITSDIGLSEGFHFIEKDSMINLFTFEDGTIPVFTSTERIFDKGIVKEQVNFLELKGKDLFSLAAGQAFILNPYSDCGKELDPKEAASLLDGTIFTNISRQIKIKKDKPVRIGQPAKYPTEVVKSLVKFFSDKPDVDTAYLAWIHDPSSADPPHYIFAIDTKGEWSELSSEAGFVAQQILGPDVIFDLMQINNLGGIEDYFVKSTTPFYKKTK